MNYLGLDQYGQLGRTQRDERDFSLSVQQLPSLPVRIGNEKYIVFPALTPEEKGLPKILASFLLPRSG
jgi:hypothetical protein